MTHHRTRTVMASDILAHTNRLARGATLLAGLVVLAVGATALASPIIGFTFRADTDLVPVRFTIDSVKPAITSTKRVA